MKFDHKTDRIGDKLTRLRFTAPSASLGAAMATTRDDVGAGRAAANGLPEATLVGTMEVCMVLGEGTAGAQRPEGCASGVEFSSA